MLNLNEWSYKKFKIIYKYVVEHKLVLAVSISIIIIVTGVFLGYENNKVVPINPAASSHYLLEPHNPLSFMSNWDGPDYLNIAKYGYKSIIQTNLFPMYPILVRLFNFIVPSLLISALLLSWLCLVIAIYFYLKIIEILFKPKNNLESLKAVLLFILFPTGIFLLATYSESLFMASALAAIYFAYKRKYLLAGLISILTTATHPNGVFLAILVGLILYEQKMNFKKIILSIAIGGLGLLGYMAFLYIKFSNAFAFVNAQKKNGWLQFNVNNYTVEVGWLNIIFFILIITSAIYWWSRHKSFSIYSILFLVVPILGGQFGGFNRYVLAAFPLQIMLYDRYRNKPYGYAICLSLSSILWAYFVFQYAGGYVGG